MPRAPDLGSGLPRGDREGSGLHFRAYRALRSEAGDRFRSSHGLREAHQYRRVVLVRYGEAGQNIQLDRRPVARLPTSRVSTLLPIDIDL